ncbi:MAG: hypothetical protein M0R80_10695 [Proteobacteria bacterium]|jgi:hypothetical protein|nr:hypothetical protein [Pseudomonadota bacterium]
MSDAKRKVLDMVEQGKITTAEADALLGAMREKPRLSLRVLFDPFDRVGVAGGLVVGVVASVVAGLVSIPLGMRFDGFMDIHAASGTVTATAAITDQLVAWPLSAIVLWLVALPFARASRPADFLAATGLVRLLPLVAGVLLAPLTPEPAALAEMSRNAMTDPGAALGDLLSMLPMVAVAIVFAGWFIAATVFAFRHASGLRGGRLAAAAVVALLAAEIVSKAAIWGLGMIA